MRVKRYVATNMQDAMVKVKMDLGKNAVIIHTRKFREGGFMGFFGRQMVEVTAAIEDQPEVNMLNTLPTAVNATPENYSSLNSTIPPEKKPDFYEVNKQVLKSLVMTEPEEEETEDISELQEEIQEMKSMMSEMMGHIENVNEIHTLPKSVQKLYQTMVTNDLDEKIAKRLIKSMLKNIDYEDLNNHERLKTHLEQLMLKIIKQPSVIKFKKQNSQQAVALVGPTGVGKTTTIAKLAATFQLVDKKKVALITADTYRIAAVEQLKTYGEIIGVPVEVVYTPQELKASLTKHADKDLVLIDTAGRSHKNDAQMSELKSFLDASEPDDVFLVLSATTKFNDMLEIITSYSDIILSKLVFTKLDETSTCGAIVNVINKTKKSLSYITVGQNVPDDIEIADPGKIVKMILEER